MVFAAGGDLRQMRGAPYTKILPLLIDIAAALEHAHTRRIVHRDLKPSNILLDGAGRPLLADFGAGASEGDNSSGPPGSPFSASPQQLAGEPARPTDDIYGLGALAYELLSGYPPFYPAFDAKKIATEPVPRLKPVKPIPPRLELLVSWLLAKQGRERPPSMRHVADEMNAVLQDTLGLEGAATEVAAESEAALLGAAADNLTPAIMADEPEMPAEPGARARGNRPGHAAAGRRAARAGGARAARAQSAARLGHRRGARARRGRVACCCRSSPANRRWTSARSSFPPGPPRASRPRRNAPKNSPRKHTELSKRMPRARLARRRAVGRPGIRRRAQIPRRNRRHARAPKIRRRAGAARRSSTKALDRHRGARARSAGRADRRRQARARRRRVRKRAPGVRHRAQDRSGQQGSDRRGSARWRRRAASCRRWRTRRMPRPPRICPRRRPCSPTCSSAIPATWRPPRGSRA